MPFKGDMRLGGPHDNEASLNGTSDGPSVPSAGTVLQSGIQNPITASIQTSVNDPTMIDVEVGTGTYNLVADGTGGTYLQLASASYLPTGTWVGPRWGDDEPNTSTYVDGFGNFYNYQNGIYSVSRHVSDGYGGVVFSQYAETYGDFYAYGTPVSGAPEESIFYLTTTHPESSSEIPNGRYTYDSLVWDGVGGISLTQGSFFTGGSYYPDGTLESDASDTYVEVPAGSNNYFFDGNDNRWEWDGNGNIVFRYSGLYSDGTYITTYEYYDYYWNGSGGFYESYNGGGGGGGGDYPSSGTILNSGEGTAYTYITELGYDVPNGTYWFEEVADGNGGSNTNYSYNYLSSETPLHVGTEVNSEEQAFLSYTNVYYPTGRYYTTAYISDGNGGYSTDSNYLAGSFYESGVEVYSDGYQDNTFEVYVSGMSYYIHNGTGYYMDRWVWDGNGGIIQGSTSVGDFYSLGSPIYDETGAHLNYWDDSTMQTIWYFHDGNGSYVTSTNSIYP